LGNSHIQPKLTLGVVVPQSSEQKTRRFGIGVPFFHSASIAELGEPLEKANESFAQSQVSLAKSVSEVLPDLCGSVGRICGVRRICGVIRRICGVRPCLLFSKQFIDPLQVFLF
jgi:hypothetical protein